MALAHWDLHVPNNPPEPAQRFPSMAQTVNTTLFDSFEVSSAPC